MRLVDLVKQYTESVGHVLETMKVVEGPTTVDMLQVRGILEHAKAYLQDAEYYLLQRRHGVSLASVAYSEGLLDALRMLGAVEFEWSHARGKMKEK